MVGNCNSLATIHRVKGVKEETVAEWIERAASHEHQLEDYIVGSCKLSQVQLDALWTYVGHKGEKGGGRKKRHEVPVGGQPPSAPLRIKQGVRKQPLRSLPQRCNVGKQR
jgi:hypothetical protein